MPLGAAPPKAKCTGGLKAPLVKEKEQARVRPRTVANLAP